MEKLLFGQAVTADFAENTITLEIENDFSICAGEFAIIKIDNISQKLAIEEFIQSLNL